ncbi:UNVERIFIED_CONTAM: Phosphoglycerate mutase-like protein 4 [Sesamum calycinum]|uniref:Phosphoglycerate mutase-like protein 4 n=1 Tax=Sesamum calycinum TaxID=2727403 RepID=A0AAW2LT43_9LAMI
MSSVGLTSVKSPRHSSPSPPLPIIRRHLSSLLFKSPKIFQPVCLSLILPDFMADSDTRASVLSQSECDENGGTIETVGPNYAEIIVIRHGETEWNADRRIQGHLDVNLNDVGRQQAAAVADRLSREPKVSAVYSSDLKRAFDTAEIIAKSCGVLEVTKDPDLRERHLGTFKALSFMKLPRLIPRLTKHLYLTKRIKKFQYVPSPSLSKVGERVVVVSHGGTIRALHKKASPHRGPTARVLNTCVNVFHVSDKEWSIKSWGDVSHLDQTGFLESGFGGDKHSG